MRLEMTATQHDLQHQFVILNESEFTPNEIDKILKAVHGYTEHLIQDILANKPRKREQPKGKTNEN